MVKYGNVQEWLIWLPWKGSGPARGPRVRIPPFPPMCDKCIKRAVGRLIVETESRLEQVWKKVEADPENLKHDPELIRLLDCISSILKKYETL